MIRGWNESTSGLGMREARAIQGSQLAPRIEGIAWLLQSEGEPRSAIRSESIANGIALPLALRGLLGFARDSRRVLARTSKGRDRGSPAPSAILPFLTVSPGAAPSAGYSWGPLLHRYSEPSIEWKKASRRRGIFTEIFMYFPVEKGQIVPRRRYSGDDDEDHQPKSLGSTYSSSSRRTFPRSMVVNAPSR